MATRSSKRVKNYSILLRNVDDSQRQQRAQSKLDMLESDYYDSPNKLAEEELSDDSKANNKKAKVLKIAKKKQNNNLRKNVNLKKILKSYPEQTQFPNFMNVITQAPMKKATQCCICRCYAKYTCPRCQERYCSSECNTTHKEIQCLRIDC